MTIVISEIQERYNSLRVKKSWFIPDESARDFVDMVEHGMSIDAVLDIIVPPRVGLTDVHREQAITKLARNNIIRQSPTMCACLGIRCLRGRNCDI